MKARKLTKRQFARAIKNGLGSAPLHIASYGDENVEAELLDACITNLVYDKQFDSGRALWLTRMISRTQRVDFYASEIKIALLRLRSDESDVGQLAWIAANLYQLGCEGLPDAMLSAFDTVCKKRSCEADYFSALVNVAGIGGLKMAARCLPELWPDSEWEMSFLAKHAVAYFEKQSIEEVFGEIGKTDSRIRSFIEMVSDFEKRSEQPFVQPVERPDLTATSRRWMLLISFDGPLPVAAISSALKDIRH